MRAQLDRWRSKIDELAEAAHVPDRNVSFDTLLQIDELKCLHAIAQSKLDQLFAAGEGERLELESAVTTAFSQLRTAMALRKGNARGSVSVDRSAG